MKNKSRIKRGRKRPFRPNRWESAVLISLFILLGILSFPMFLPETVWRLNAVAPALGNAENGAYIADAAGCATCHSTPGYRPYSGGYAIHTPFGDVVASNITPDLVAGIGAWQLEDFRRAMVLGLSPKGRHYYPAFPYSNYKDIRESDLRDLFAYLKTLPPSDRLVEESRLNAPFSFRPAMAMWKLLYLDPPRPVSSRGAYLTEVLGHCGMCHTSRNLLGAPRSDLHLAGVSDHASINAGVPNLTPHIEGLGAWSTESLDRYLTSAVRPDGQISGGQMAEVIEHITSRLTILDRGAMIAYLRSLPAQQTP